MGECEELSLFPLVMLKPSLGSRVIFPHPTIVSHILMEDAVHCFSPTGPDTSFSNYLHLHFTLAAAPIATTRPCHLLELLHVWNPELWNSPFWPQPLILLSVPSLSCPWNMFFGLIGTLGLLTFPYVSSISLPPNSIPIPTLFVQPFQLYSHNYVQLSYSFDLLFYLSF